MLYEGLSSGPIAIVSGTVNAVQQLADRDYADRAVLLAQGTVEQ